MKINSDTNTKIKELQDEAERKRNLEKYKSLYTTTDIPPSPIESATKETLVDKKNNKVIQRTLKQYLSGIMSSVDSSINKKAQSQNELQTKIIESYSKSVNKNISLGNSNASESNIEFNKKININNTVKNNSKTTETSKGSNRKKSKSESSLASDESLKNFLKKSSSKKESNSNNTIDEINISYLLKDVIREGLDKEYVVKMIDSIYHYDKKDINRNNIYSLMKRSLSKVKGNKITGLDTYLASLEDVVRVKNRKIDISSEIVRTNFIIKDNINIPETYFTDTDIYLDNMLNNLPKAVKLKNIFNELKKIPGITNVDRSAQKEYHIPNWIKDWKKGTIDYRVKQLNKLSKTTAKASLNGEKPKETAFIKSLNQLTDFKSTGAEDGKEGFSQNGITIDELNNIRSHRLANEKIDSSFFISNAKNKIKSFDKFGFVSYSVGTLGNPLILPSFTLGNVNISKKPLSTNNGDYGVGSLREDFYHKVYNSSVKALLDKAPDFRQNMYVGMFVYTMGDGSQIKDFDTLQNSIEGYKETDKLIGMKSTSNLKGLVTRLTEAYERVLKAYFVRIQGIKVPGASIESYEIPFLNRKLKMPGTTFNEKHTLQIDFSVDEFGLIMRGFNLLTGQFSYIYNDEQNNRYAGTLFPADFPIKNQGRLDLIITYNDFRINPNITDSYTRSSYMPGQQNVESENDDIVSGNGERIFGSPDSYRKFILENVKILGFDGNLSLKRDNAGKITVPLKIVFRRITTIDANKTK